MSKTNGAKAPAHAAAALSHKPKEGELKNQFAYHPADASTGEKHDKVRENALKLAKWFAKYLPDCQEAARAIENVRVAMFWANAAVACHGEDEKPNPSTKTLIESLAGDEGDGVE